MDCFRAKVIVMAEEINLSIEKLSEMVGKGDMSPFLRSFPDEWIEEEQKKDLVCLRLATLCQETEALIKLGNPFVALVAGAKELLDLAEKFTELHEKLAPQVIEILNENAFKKIASIKAVSEKFDFKLLVAKTLVEAVAEHHGIILDPSTKTEVGSLKLEVFAKAEADRMEEPYSIDKLGEVLKVKKIPKKRVTKRKVSGDVAIEEDCLPMPEDMKDW